MRIRKWGMMAATAALVGLSAIGMAGAAGYTQTNLVSDQPGASLITDASLINPWGMAASAASPIWVSDNGTGVVTLYAVNPATNVPTKQALTVSIPGAGSVTGQVFSPPPARARSMETVFSSSARTGPYRDGEAR